MEEVLSSERFNKTVKDFLDGRNKCNFSEAVLSLETLIDCFRILAERIYSFFHLVEGIMNHEACIELMVDAAYEKIDNFKKGNAFNYFTTVMLCHLRQQYKASKAFKNKRSIHEKHG